MPERRITRILVALDASAHSLAALSAAADLAAALQAELRGLFVEDINLLHLAELPFATEVASVSATGRRLDAARLQRAMQRQAEALRRSLASAAEPLRVLWSFEVSRGAVASTLLAAAEDVDLLIIGQSGNSIRPRGRLGSTARSVVEQGRRSVVILRHGTKLGRPVLVYFDGSEVGLRALAAAAELAHADHDNLVVLLAPAESAAAKDRLHAQGEAWLGREGLAARFRQLIERDLTNLESVVRQEGGQVLVLGAAGAFAGWDRAEALLEGLSCPLVLIR